jgi:hypothetical protein
MVAQGPADFFSAAPDGLKFIQLRYKLQWAESNTRVLLIEEQGLSAEFKKLGGSIAFAVVARGIWTRAIGRYTSASS